MLQGISSWRKHSNHVGVLLRGFSLAGSQGWLLKASLQSYSCQVQKTCNLVPVDPRSMSKHVKSQSHHVNASRSYKYFPCHPALRWSLPCWQILHLTWNEYPPPLPPPTPRHTTPPHFTPLSDNQAHFKFFYRPMNRLAPSLAAGPTAAAAGRRAQPGERRSRSATGGCTSVPLCHPGNPTGWDSPPPDPPAPHGGAPWGPNSTRI